MSVSLLTIAACRGLSLTKALVQPFRAETSVHFASKIDGDLAEASYLLGNKLNYNAFEGLKHSLAKAASYQQFGLNMWW